MNFVYALTVPQATVTMESTGEPCVTSPNFPNPWFFFPNGICIDTVIIIIDMVTMKMLLRKKKKKKKKKKKSFPKTRKREYRSEK